MRHFIPHAVLLGGALLDPAAAGGQAVLDWPLVLEARPAVLADGAGAVLLNPAGAGAIDARAEALVADLETPDAMGLRALTIAGSVRLVGGWGIAAGYRRVGVGDMVRTDGPPVGSGQGPLPVLEVAEDVYALGVSYRAPGIGFGFAGRIDTPADALGGKPAWAGTFGASWAPRVPFLGLRLAATMELDEDDPAVAAAAQLDAPPLLDERLRLGVAFGTRIEHTLGLEHALVATGVWRGIAELQAGAAAQPGAEGTRWVPLVAGLVRLGRYRLGIVREHLPNGFGAAMHYRLSVGF